MSRLRKHDVRGFAWEKTEDDIYKITLSRAHGLGNPENRALTAYGRELEKLMEKNSVLGELLYIGLIFEKTRCKSAGLWKRSYFKSLNKHIDLLKKVACCLQAPFSMERDNEILKEVCLEIQSDNKLKNYYPIKMNFAKNTCKYIITNCDGSMDRPAIVKFIICMLEDLSTELKKGFHKNKEKICKLIFSLHNLPRVYLKNNENTLCMLNQEGISSDLAFTYSKLSMDEEMKSRYEHFLIHKSIC